MGLTILYWVTFKVLYSKVKNVLCFFMYYLYKYYKPVIVQYCIADSGSWVPRLTLLDLRTYGTSECSLGTDLVCM